MRECKASRGLKMFGYGLGYSVVSNFARGIGFPRFIVSTQILCKKCGVNQSLLGLTWGFRGHLDMSEGQDK